MYTSQHESKPALKNPKTSSYSTGTLFSSPTPQNSLSQFIETEEQRDTPQPWDELGSEASEHAQIWHVYNDESTKLDVATIDGCNRGIDVLLVFTGLFSAVLTTFIIQSYQQMVPSSSDTTNVLLSELILDLRRSSVLNSSDSGASLPAAMGGTPSISQLRWVNGLWFAALSCSLSAALVSMLAKQWIQPVPNISGSPRHRARQRQRRHAQLQNWHVFVVINALPILLHVALLLFFAGIIVLLWSGDVAIVTATFTIVALAYTFYLGSMWMSLVYPDCPYQHPISEQLRHWISRRNAGQVAVDLENRASERPPNMRTSMAPTTVNNDDYVDACSLMWLLQQCSNDDTVMATLQAIGGLPREFSAFHVLREAGAIPMVFQHFSCCFHRDLTFDKKWEVIDADGAERYCRAWVRLTHGTSESWPSDLRAPLNTLKDLSEKLHVSAIATCASALDALDSRNTQLALLSHIKRLARGESIYDDLTRRWLLDTFLECSLSWELYTAVFNDIVKKAIPILIQLFQQEADKSGSQSRTIIVLIIHSLTTGNVDPVLLWDEEMRRMNFPKILIPSLATIIQSPDRFGVEGELLNFTITEFSRHASSAFTRSWRFPSHVKGIARQGLSKLYLEGRIGVGLVPDPVLVDILQMLYPPVDITVDQQRLFVKTLIKTLTTSVDVNVDICSIRLLEPLLTNCQSSVIHVFTEENGFAALLRAAHTGDTDSRRLQLDCIRTLCVFIRSSTNTSVRQEANCPSQSPAQEKQLNAIFQSDFFTTLISAVGARRWWLPEIADTWVPSLLCLCRVSPHEHIWRSVEAVFRNFAEINVGEDGLQRLVDDLDEMKAILDVRT
ncbi:hypothetical protein GALMADRAFT_248800 [Galerina marginata CBS 339.88]|uniref:DUF6535 domain-containing protein n=1 Tax=Galerina marginata (strain CBS 339.88) TaxID=685588 RepID=A0A067SVP7_GALM3|nr:hypothetical protein GALMADRAFT_248800 [Galerina marginata CBS 339.88]